MIEIKNLKKSYGDTIAINNLNIRMAENEIFGLVGTNGAGKTTLLRMMSGIFRPDEGELLIDDKEVYDNPDAKSLFYFIPDDPYFFQNGSAKKLLEYHLSVFRNFDEERFHKLMGDFGLDENRKVNGYSKGMKKQLAVILALCSCTKYLFCDETFDGLDPVMRQATKSLMARDMTDRGLTVVMTSHNLRELEDICDHVGLLHKGGVLLSRDLGDMKLGVQKVQVAFLNDEDRTACEMRLDVIEHRTQGRVHIYTLRHTREALEEIFNDYNTILLDILPLTLEEIFISETEVVGYDIQKIING